MSGVLRVIEALLFVAWFLAGMKFYLPLAKGVLVRNTGKVQMDWVEKIDAILATLLMVWFASLGVDALQTQGEQLIKFRNIIEGALIYISLLVLIFGLMIYRGLRMTTVFGFGQCGFLSALWKGVFMLIAAYPVIILAQLMVQGGSNTDMSMQDVVKFLKEAGTMRDKLAMMVMAIVVAPIAEETIFRGYLYPVGKRYFGPLASMIATSLLFAILHGHAPSIPGLFLLAMCFSLVYERTGSLLVSMIMHALFNTISVIGILYIL